MKYFEALNAVVNIKVLAVTLDEIVAGTAAPCCGIVAPHGIVVEAVEIVTVVVTVEAVEALGTAETAIVGGYVDETERKKV